MKIGDYTHITLDEQPIYALGDLHGAWERLKNEIESKDITDCAFIICGDIGIGFNHEEVDKKKLEEINKFLKNRNLTLICLRGNHDKPSIFNRDIEDVTKTQDFWYSNLKLVPDYTVLSINGKNILMIGGATSIDREKRKHEYRIRVKGFMDAYPVLDEESAKEIVLPSYWEGEIPYVDREAIEKIKNDNILITHVLTHTCPSFATPKRGKLNLKSWFELDPFLENDLDYERSVMDNIYDVLLEYSHPLEEWVFGHFHTHWQQDMNGIRFTTLLHTDWTFDPYEITRLNIDEIEI